MIKPLQIRPFSGQTAQNIQKLLSEGKSLIERDLLGAAAHCYRKVLQIDANSLEALHVLGSIEFNFNKFADALNLLSKAVVLQSENAQLHLLYGKCARQLKKYDAAEVALNCAIEIDANLSEAHLELGLVYFQKNDLKRSVNQYRRLLAFQPRYYDAWNNLGLALKDSGNFGEAMSAFDQAILLDPKKDSAFANRGVLLHMMGRLGDALNDLNQAVALAPESSASHLSRGQLLLTIGEYAQGWDEFEFRWNYLRDNFFNTERYHQTPLWSGRESLVDKTILLYAEQGLGDTLQFCRYVSLVAMLGGKVILECEPALYQLMHSLQGVSQIIIQGTTDIKHFKDFDFQCPLMSLPRVFRTRLESIPNNVPYLSASIDKMQDWAKKLGHLQRPKVGLVWSGGHRLDQPELWAVNNRRNIPLHQLAALKDLPASFISLQKGVQAELELRQLQDSDWDGPSIDDFTCELHDFSDTAALIANLDLVISVDTSTAHLAGAMGKPTWILNRYDTCWRWLLNRTDSPWYPSVKIFRQSTIGSWDNVVSQLRVDLLQYCENF